MREITTIEEFQQYLQKGNFIVDFYADWCAPCQVFKIILEQVQQKVPIEIVKVNVDTLPELAQQFGISAIPHLIFFKDGVPVKEQSGLLTEDVLLDIIKQVYGL